MLSFSLDKVKHLQVCRSLIEEIRRPGLSVWESRDAAGALQSIVR